MKKNIQIVALPFLLLVFSSSTIAQDNLAPDQNPSFNKSRDKYMGMADSVNQLHSTTVQQTYKAYDWYEAKMERRAARTEFKRQLRLERARSRHYYWNNGYNQYYRMPVRYGYHYRQSPWYFLF